MPPARVTLGVLTLLGLFNLVRGGLHVFLADSGAASIAGFDLDAGGKTIVFLLALAGVGQIAAGVIDLLAAWRFRAFAAALLAVETGKAALVLFVAFVSKPPPHEIPGRTGMLVTLAVLGLALVWQLARPKALANG
ncbi:MAG TPA: hypothetical protein VEA44_09870 [Caulobacter sp.]|nr:hypothetical protein [Caulobacter sp.]